MKIITTSLIKGRAPKRVTRILLSSLILAIVRSGRRTLNALSPDNEIPELVKISEA